MRLPAACAFQILPCMNPACIRSVLFTPHIYFFFGESRVCLALTWYICAALCAGTISGREEGLACAASRRDDRHVAGVGRPPPTALVFYQTLSSHAVVARLLASAHELSTASFHASVYRYVCLGKPVFECVYSASKLLM